MDTQKDLGVIISNDMSWILHIDKAGLKANKTFFAIKRNISPTSVTYEVKEK